MSLKNELFEAVKNSYPNMFSVERAENLARSRGRKTSNAERRLRELCETENSLIRAIKNKKKYIIGHIYQPNKELQKLKVDVKPIQDKLFETTKFYLN